MTAEIAILNGQGIALAADSAVTIDRGRVWQNANKLFSLSPIGDMGLMVYGGGSFLGLPWEAVVKTFRTKNSAKRYKTVSSCASAFIKYLESLEIGGEKHERFYAARICDDVIRELVQSVQIRHPEDKDAAEKILREEIIGLLSKMKGEPGEFNIRDDCVNPTDDVFKSLVTTELCHRITPELELTEEDYKNLADCCLGVMRTKSKSSYYTGVVVAGFGDDEMLPVLCHYVVDGKIDGQLRVWEEKDKARNLNESDGAFIIPFAQSDVFSLFMDGMSSNNLDFTMEYMRQVTELIKRVIGKSSVKSSDKEAIFDAADELFSQFCNNFRFHLFERNALPIMSVVQTLPKEEMGAMAEALIELTTLRRKLDSPLQSVGGPTDVAVISKGDGFIWLKRKHYFDINMNRDFISRKKQ